MLLPVHYIVHQCTLLRLPQRTRTTKPLPQQLPFPAASSRTSGDNSPTSLVARKKMTQNQADHPWSRRRAVLCCAVCCVHPRPRVQKEMCSNGGPWDGGREGHVVSLFTDARPCSEWNGKTALSVPCVNPHAAAAQEREEGKSARHGRRPESEASSARPFRWARVSFIGLQWGFWNDGDARNRAHQTLSEDGSALDRVVGIEVKCSSV